jgi:hypothetical protein
VLGRAAKLTICEMRSKGDDAGPCSFFFLVGLALVMIWLTQQFL